MMNSRKNWVRGAAWILSIILFLQAAPVGAAEGWSGFSGVLEASDRYTVRFMLDGETAETLFVPVGIPIGPLPDVAERPLYAFEGWFNGDEAVDADFVPTGETTLVGRYALLSPTQTLTGETALGTAAYFDLQGENLPGGAAATVRTFENQAILEKVESDRVVRILCQIQFGVSDPYWTNAGPIRVSFSFREPIALKDGEDLLLLDRDGRAVQDASFTAQEGQLTGVAFTADALGAFSIVGCYAEEAALYTVTFLDDGKEIEVRQVACGQPVGAFPKAPEKDGYIFTDWTSPDIADVNGDSLVYADVTVIASYERDYPATTAFGAANGVSVYMDVPEGALPADASFRMTEVEGEDYRAAVEKAMGGEVGVIKAVDMSFVDEKGNEYQPLKPVTVEVTVTGMGDAERLSVVHFAADGSAEVVYSGQPETVRSRGAKSADSGLKTFSFQATGFSVYAVIGGEEPTARIQINFHIIGYEEGEEAGSVQEVDTVLSTVFVKRSDTVDELKLIVYDPGVGQLGELESFRGWTFNKDYTAAQATTEYDKTNHPEGAMTIEDVRAWVQSIQGTINEGDELTTYDLYAMVLKHYSVTYLDRFGVSLDTDSAYMLRNEEQSTYTINQVYETNDDDYHFKGWITETENLITDPNPTPETVTIQVALDTEPVTYEDKDYKLYTNNTTIKLSGDVTFKAHAPKGKWLIFHEVMKGATYTAPQFLEEGESPDMPDPEQLLLLGYTFDGWYKTYSETTDPDTGEITRTYSDPFTPGPITAKTNIYAKWVPANWAPYNVIIWKQNLDGTYAYAESIQLYGTVGDTILTTGNTSVNAAGNNILASINNNDADYLAVNGRDKNNNPVTANYRAVHSMTVNNNRATHTYSNPAYVGFNCARIDQGVTINPEGNTVVNVYYDRIEYTIKVYFARSSGNNYYVATTRTGTNDNQGLGPGATNYGMNWTNAITYHQNTDGSWATGYDNNIPEDVRVYTETSGGYTYYYTTITAKYGANISADWPRYSWFPNLAINNNPNNNNNTYGFVSWYMENEAAGWQGAGSGLNTFKGIISKMDEKLLGDITTSNGNLLFGRHDGSELYYYTYMIWFEALDGVDYAAQDIQTTTGDNGKTYYLKETFIAHSRVATPTTATQGPTYSGFTLVDSDQPAQAVNHQATCQFYYDRVANPIVYRDGAYYDGNNNYLSAYPPQGADQESDEIPFETDITSYNGGYNAAGELVAGENYKTDYPSSYDGFVFEGWYSDKACTTPFTFTTMPDTSITVYAKFRQVQYRVFLHPNVPTGKYVTWGSASQQMNFRGTYGTNISLPTGKLITSEETPELYDDTYEFSGWYRDDAPFRLPFDPDAYVLTDKLATEYDKTREMTDTMDKYGVIHEPSSNSDITGNNGGDRWWITKKIDLYGKWVKKLEAGTGIQIIYDPNGGSDEVVDLNLYKDGTNAVAQSAPLTPPNSTVVDENNQPLPKVFLYWVLQKWDPTAGEDGQGAFVDVSPLRYAYPGDSFAVSFANAHTVETTSTDPDTGESVTKTEYFIQLRAEYADPEAATLTHIWWYSNYGNNTVIKDNQIPRKDGDQTVIKTVQEFRINEGVNIKPEDTFTREGYYFLGWARVDSTDSQGNAVSGHPALHPELGYDDLFLRYVEASGNTEAHFEAQNSDGDWVTVTQVAADEHFPYHDLYAVWAKLEVTKTVTGVDEDDYTRYVYSESSQKAYTFVVRMPNDKYYVTGSGFSATSIEDATKFTVYPGSTVGTEGDPMTPAFRPGKYQFIEITDDAAIPGYSLDTANSVTATEGKVNNNSVTEVEFKNAYIRDKGTLIINKTVTGHESGAFPYTVKIRDSLGRWLTSEHTLTDDAEQAGEFTIERDGETLSGTLTLTDVPTGTYTVIEQGTEEGGAAQITNYTLAVTYDYGSETAEAVEVTKDGSAEVGIENEYTMNVVDLVLTKQVTGNLGSIVKDFSFTVQLQDGTAVTVMDLSGEEEISQPFDLKSGEAVLLKDVPIGATVVITESGAQKYTASATLDGSSSGVTVTGNPTANGTDNGERTIMFIAPEPLEDGNSITVINDQHMDPPPTGLRLDRGAYFALLCLALVLGAALTADAWKEKLQNRE